MHGTYIKIILFTVNVMISWAFHYTQYQ